jgi:hypothetical protein
LSKAQLMNRSATILRIITAILLAFVLCETVLIIFKFGATSYSNTLTDNYHYLQGSKIVEINEGYAVRSVNSLGFLDRNYDKKAKAFRFILTGNSISEALQVPTDSVYDNLLEDTLSVQLGKRTEIWNLARNGARLLDNMDALPHFTDSLEYDAAIVQFNPTNYINIRASKNEIKIQGDSLTSKLASRKANNIFNKIDQKLRETFVTWNMMMTRVYVLSRFLNNVAKKRSLNVDLENNDADKVTSTKRPVMKDEEIQYFDNLLSVLTKKLLKKNTKVFFFVYPLQKDSVASAVYFQVCNNNNIRFIDLSKYQELQDTVNYPAAGFLNTQLGKGHLNAKGHRLLANILDNEILAYLNSNDSLHTK